MLGADKIEKIRRACYQDGNTIRGIRRDLSVSRVTIRKVLLSEATAFSYVRRTQPSPKIGPWQSELDGILSENAARPESERLTHMRTFEDSRAQGYEGGYDAARRYAARWRKGRNLNSDSDAHDPSEAASST